MNKNQDNPIFIVGCRRSGTTLMLDILNHHPQIGLAPETHFIAELLKKLKKIDINKDRDETIEILYSVKTIPYNPYWKKNIPLTKNIIRNNIYEKNKEILDYKRLFKKFLKLVADLQNKNRYGEKSPKHTYHIDTIKKWFPNAKIIQMIRDPRAVAASHIYRVAKPEFPYFHIQYLKILKYWMSTANLIKKYRTVYPNDFYVVKFEEIVTNPKENIKKICKFIDEEYSEDMLKPSLFLSSFNKEKNNYGFETSTLNRWKEKMPNWSIKIINFFCDKYMVEFGYKK